MKVYICTKIGTSMYISLFKIAKWLQITPVSTKRRIDDQNALCPCNQILLSNKERAVRQRIFMTAIPQEWETN